VYQEDQLSGSSGHIHQSLVERASGQPAFYNNAQPSRMTPVFRHFIAAFEASACERRVSDVERRRYFEMV
jgi:glutamine synthetase